MDCFFPWATTRSLGFGISLILIVSKIKVTTKAEKKNIEKQLKKAGNPKAKGHNQKEIIKGLSDSSKKQKAKNMVAGIVIGILVLSSVIIGGVFLFGNRKIKNAKSSEKYKVQEYTFYKAEPKNLPIGTSHIAGVYSDEYDSKYHSLYIGQLITLFGEADYTTDSNENLTSYTIGAEDNDGNVIYLEAYYGPSGPAIGGMRSDVNVKEAANELIGLIRSAAPTDYRLTSIYEDFPAIIIMGVKNGEPYYNSRMGISWFPRRIILMLDLLFQR